MPLLVEKPSCSKPSWLASPRAPSSFSPCAGAFNYLKENFSNAPSLDMSAASLTMLVQLMLAQVQECVFEKVTLLRAQKDFLTWLQLAQEAARVRSPQKNLQKAQG